jgi:hypothetical protein
MRTRIDDIEEALDGLKARVNALEKGYGELHSRQQITIPADLSEEESIMIMGCNYADRFKQVPLHEAVRDILKRLGIEYQHVRTVPERIELVDTPPPADD